MSTDASTKNLALIKGEKSAPEKNAPQKGAEKNDGEKEARQEPRPTTTVPEKKLPGVLGLTREQLLEWRQKTGMEEGREFVTVGKEVHLTFAGLQRVAALANLPAESLLFLLEAGPGPELLIAHGVCTNARILLCKKGEDVVRVQVRSNRNFVPGMAVPAVHEQGDLYRLEHACPRWRGRW